VASTRDKGTHNLDHVLADSVGAWNENRMKRASL
jgi:hypothetical protein